MIEDISGDGRACTLLTHGLLSNESANANANRDTDAEVTFNEKRHDAGPTCYH